MEVFIWKESIYKNDFKCKCGAKLFDRRTNAPTENVGVDAEKTNALETELWCCKCRNLVGKVKQIDDKQFDDKEKADVLNGDINEWLANKEKTIKSEVKTKTEERIRKNLQKEVQSLFDKLQDAENAMKRYKIECEKMLAKKDKQIQELTKEIDGLNAQMRKMEKQILGTNKFTNMRDS